MAIVERIEAGQADVEDLRMQLGRLREALDRTDAVLGAADEALEKAGEAVATTRVWAPRIGIIVGVAAVVVVAVVVVRRSRSRRDDA